MNIVVLDGYAANPGDISWEPLERLGKLTVYDRTAREDIASRIAGAEIVLTNKAPLDRETLAGAMALKLVSVLATGYNIVDTAAAKELGIAVCNVPGYSTMSVAQLTFALLLEITHRVGLHSDAIHDGAWVRSPDFAYWQSHLMELDGKVMGIVGGGTIGMAVARIAAAFGMRVLATSRSRRTGSDGAVTFVPMEELLRRSDVISLHCPLTDETKDLVRTETIAQMKDGVILLNTARGPIVNEADLAAALASGKVGAAGIDVLSAEPMRADNPLLGAKNCFLTPHIGWAPYEARVRLMNETVRNVEAYLAGELIHRVN